MEGLLLLLRQLREEMGFEEGDLEMSLSPYPSRIIKTVGFLLIIFPFLSLIENLSGTALH